MHDGGRDRRDPERGAVAALSVFFVVLLLLFLGLTINIGRLLRARGDLQAAADAAALAAAEALDVKGGTGGPYSTGGVGGGHISMGGTGGGREQRDFNFGVSTSAGAMAQLGASFLVMNEVGQHPSIDSTPGGDVKFGFWHYKTAPEPCAFSNGSCNHGWEVSPFQPPTFANPMALFAINAISVSANYQLRTILGGIVQAGNVPMKATSYATTRRAQVACAMPAALATYDAGDPAEVFLDAATAVKPGFNCTGQIFYFISQNGGCSASLARADVSDQAPAGDMKQFVRAEFFDHCANDTPDVRYRTGAARVPSIGMADHDIRPVVDGLLGIASAGAVKTGTCRLGTQVVLPVIKYGVKFMNPCPATPWPPDTGSVPLVVGFANVLVRQVRCKDGTLLNAANCNNPAMATAAQYCSGFADATADPFVRLETRIWCDAPTGPNNSYALAQRPRLVK